MRRVLLINDYSPIMERTAGMLDDMGWEVGIATSQETALWTFNNRRPNLVVVDIEMRGGVGHEIISRIRRTDKKLFILAVTRSSPADTLLKVAAVCGANHHVIGPVSQAKLCAAIEAGRTRGFSQAGTQ